MKTSRALGVKLFRCACGKGKNQLGQAVLVGGVSIGDVRLGLLQLGLRELDDRAKAEVVAGLGEVESEAGLLAQLLGDGEAFVGAIGVLPGDANVAGNG